MKRSTRRGALAARTSILALVVSALTAAGPWACSHAEDRAAEPAEPPSFAAASTAPPASARVLADQLSELFEDAASKVSPSVVPIFSQQKVSAGRGLELPDEAFRRFFGDELPRRFFGPGGPGAGPGPGPGFEGRGGDKQVVRGLGSGVIVSADGYILTNNHVVDHADELTVVLADKTKHKAKVIGTDPQTDVAVIRIDAKDLPAARLGRSDRVKVGQWVIAVGNPFQLMHTVTSGIISAKGRSNVGLADYEDFIQTDASINPGNSGGALADLDGAVIGINTAISTPSGGSVGIGFAIPIDMAKDVMDKLIHGGKITRGYLGVAIQDVDENMAKALELSSTEGALIGDLTKKGPAEAAGLERGDVVVSYEGKPVSDSTDLRNRVAAGSPGSKVPLGVIRDGGEKTLTVTLGERPENLGKGAGKDGSGGEEDDSSEALGLTTQTLTPELARQLGYQGESGVVVSDVARGGAADEAGLRRGDLVREVNQQPVKDLAAFQKASHGLTSGDTVALLVERRGSTFFVAVRVP